MIKKKKSKNVRRQGTNYKENRANREIYNRVYDKRDREGRKKLEESVKEKKKNQSIYQKEGWKK